LNPLQAAYCLMVVGAFIVIAIADPATALCVVVGLAVIFGAYVGLEWMFGGNR